MRRALSVGKMVGTVRVCVWGEAGPISSALGARMDTRVYTGMSVEMKMMGRILHDAFDKIKRRVGKRPGKLNN